MRRAYGILPWGIIALGALHMAAAFSRYDALSEPALWFFSGGIPLVFIGAVNLLNRAYGSVAPGLRWFSLAANVAMSGVTLVGGIVTNASASGLVIVVGVMSGVTILSGMRSTIHIPDRAVS